MRLWSLHPQYLDSKGLVALWREGLLAQHVLMGWTRAYTNHPQLERFRAAHNTPGAIASYLRGVADEAERRGYHFDRSKIINRNIRSQLPVNSGQIQYEKAHLLTKLEIRDYDKYLLLKQTQRFKTHPVFIRVRGPIEKWERV